MKKVKAEGEVVIELTKASREPLLSNGIDIGNFDINDFIQTHLSEIDTIGHYVIWNRGKPELNHIGGKDVIAFLYQDKDGTIRGWSR